MVRWVALVSAAWMSCSSVPPAPAPQTNPSVPAFSSNGPSGKYVLKTIDGSALPTRPNDRDRPANAGPGPLVIGGSLVIEPGGEARYVLDFRGPQGRDNAIRMNTSLKHDGDQLVLVWPNGARTPVTFDGRTFIIDNIGMKLLFEREP